MTVVNGSGISLSEDQFLALKDALPEILALLPNAKKAENAAEAEPGASNEPADDTDKSTPKEKGQS